MCRCHQNMSSTREKMRSLPQHPGQCLALGRRRGKELGGHQLSPFPSACCCRYQPPEVPVSRPLPTRAHTHAHAHTQTSTHTCTHSHTCTHTRLREGLSRASEVRWWGAGGTEQQLSGLKRRVVQFCLPRGPLAEGQRCRATGTAASLS